MLTQRQSTICELVFPSAILGVRLNRRRLVAVLDAALHIYDISNMKILHAIDTGPNPKGLCAMTSSSEPCYAAYPADVPSERGGPAISVVIYNLDEFAMVNVVHAHRARIAFLALNAAGTMLATASEKGTVVRVFSVPDGRLLHQFRRGSYPACIRCITFNAASTLLCVTSDSDTVHLFRLAVPRTDALATLADKQRGTLLDLCKRQSAALGRGMAGSLSGYLPSSFTEMWEPTRDFAWLKLPTQGIAASAAISNASPLVMVLTTTGYFCTYSVDLDRGGECSLIKRTHAVAN